MSFHSIDYVLFLPLVVLLYFWTPQRFRWGLLLLSSYLFYASWRLEFLPILWFTTLIDYVVARLLPHSAGAKRKALFALSLFSNLGMLFAFKYFAALANVTMLAMGQSDFEPFDILLPLGISFYTFQTLGYTIDVFRGKRKPERHIGYFAVYVSYFPQLLAGPIERPGKLLPELKEPRTFSLGLAAAGAALILVGYFKKLVIADRLSLLIPSVLSSPQDHPPIGVMLASLGVMYQYYADLSGYADIAIGSSMLIGIKLSQNFNRPFAASSMVDYWQRWHITVTNWFRDYVFLPIALRSRLAWRRQLATFATMMVVAMWHGASWGWFVGGILASMVMVIESTLRRSHRAGQIAQHVAGIVGIGSGGLSFIQRNSNRLVLWIFLMFLGTLVNSPEMSDAIAVWTKLAEVPGQIASLNFSPGAAFSSSFKIVLLLFVIIGLEIYQWFDSRKPVFDRLAARGLIVSWGFYYAVATVIVVIGVFDVPGFIYFKF